MELGERIGSFCKQSKIEIDTDNSIVVYSNSSVRWRLPTPTSGLYITRYAPNGDVMTQYQITKDDNFDTPIIGGISIDSEGNFIVTGSYHVSLKIGTVTFGTPGAQSNAPVHLFIAKFSGSGGQRLSSRVKSVLAKMWPLMNLITYT